MSQYTKAVCRAAANSALLACIKEQPAAPSHNAHATHEASSALSLRHETQLVEHLAFISSLKHDPNGVTAVCIEADRDRAGVTIRVAINTGCLSHIVQGFQVIADIMMQASRHGT